MPRLIEERIRLEDLLFPIAVLISFPLFIKYSRKYAMVFLYYSYVIFVTIIGILRQEVSPLGLIIYLKEFQYIFLSLFLLEYRFRGGTLEDLKLPVKIILGIFGLWGLKEVLMGNITYYGITAINERSPSLSGWTFVGGAIIFYILHKKRGMTLLDKLIFSSFFISVLFIGSRTGLIMIVLFLSFLIAKNITRFMGVLFILVPIVFILGLILFVRFGISEKIDSDESVFRSIGRYEGLLTITDTFESSRFDAWKKRDMKNYHPIERLIGKGRGFSNMEWEFSKKGQWRGFSMVVDSQYIRNFQEIGILGSFLFILMLFSFYRVIPQKNWLLYSTILLIYLISFTTMESFLISKPGSLYWILVGLLVKVKPRLQHI